MDSPGGAGADDPDRGGGNARAAGLDALACLAFALVGAYVSQGLWPDPATRVLVLNAGDHALQEWHLGHGTLLWTGDVPLSLVTDRMNAPDGINLMANVTFLLLGALMTPVTLGLGAPVSFALLTGLNLAGTAAAWYLLFVRTLGMHRLAGFLGALLCGFAPSAVSQSVAHPHMAACWLVPPVVWCVVHLARGRYPVRTGLLLAGLVTAQVFIGEEILLLTAISLGVFTAVYAVADRRLARAAWRPMLTGLAVASITSGAALAYPLWVQFAGRQSVPSGVFNPAYFTADLASLTALSPLSLAGTDANARLASGASEYNSFLGVPLLILSVAAAAWMWPAAAARAVTFTAVAMLALSFGPEIVIDTERTGVPGPFRYVADVPGLKILVDKALPTRFGVAVAPLLAVLLVLATHRALTDQGLVERFGQRHLLVPAALVAALAPIAPTPLPTGDRAPVPDFVLDGHWRDCVPSGGVLVPVPLPTPGNPDTLRWAAAANGRFAVPEGYFIGPYAEHGRATLGVHSQPTAEILKKVAETGDVPGFGDEQRAQARADADHWRASCVALAAGAAAVPNADALRRALDSLYGLGERLADAWIWRV